MDRRARKSSRFHRNYKSATIEEKTEKAAQDEESEVVDSNDN